MEDKYLQFAKFISDFLGIEQPTFEIASEATFESATILAKLDAKKRVVYIKENPASVPALLLAIAHELRHLWQFEKGFDKFVKNYKFQNSNTENCNSQLAEIDAHAFSKIVMVDCFGIAPQFENLSDEIKKQIDLRIKEIKEEAK